MDLGFGFGDSGGMFNVGGGKGKGPLGGLQNFVHRVIPGSEYGETQLGLWTPGGGGGGGGMDSFLSMYPEYTPGYDPNTMSMTKRMEELDPIYSKGINAISDKALQKGRSGWLNAARFDNDLRAQTAKEKAGNEAAGATAEARSQLAAQGGLSSGARERIAEGGVKNLLNMNQDVNRQAAQGNLGLSIKDEENKLAMLSALPGLEQNRLNSWEQARNADITQQVNEAARRSNYQMDIYKTKAQAMAAERQAAATENAGKK